MLLFFYYHCTLHAKIEKRLSILFKGGLITRETKQSIHLCNIYLIKLFETETRLKWGQSARWVTILLSCGTIARLQLAVKKVRCSIKDILYDICLTMACPCHGFCVYPHFGAHVLTIVRRPFLRTIAVPWQFTIQYRCINAKAVFIFLRRRFSCTYPKGIQN